MENVLVIGIAGGSGSGKTTLMKNIIAHFSDSITVLSHDNYYKRHDELPFEDRCKLNYDEPAALDTDFMAQQLSSFAMDTPSTARYMTSPCTTGRTRPSILSRRRSLS